MQLYLKNIKIIKGILFVDYKFNTPSNQLRFAQLNNGIHWIICIKDYMDTFWI